MTTVFDRLQYNFDTTRFDGAANLTSAASNTISLIANNTPDLQTWQKTDLSSGSIVRTNYFKNPTTQYNSSMMVSCGIIVMDSLACANTDAMMLEVFLSANNLISKINSFQSHTNNVSGVTLVTSPDVPGYDISSGYGQLSMMTLAKSDGVPANTVPILGAFTSLFIEDILQANTSNLSTYSTQLHDSITITLDHGGNTTYTSNLTPTEITNIIDYLNSTAGILNTRITHDFNFFNNTVQVTKDSAFLQQFSNLGGTNTYLVKNVVGTTSLVNKLNSGS